MPELPTVDEAGVPGYEYHTWFGFWAPKDTPQPIVEKLNAEVQRRSLNPLSCSASLLPRASRRPWR